MMDEAALIARHVEETPRFPGAADAWLRDSGVPVWALAGYYEHAGARDAARVAVDGELRVAAVEAALACTRRH